MSQFLKSNKNNKIEIYKNIKLNSKNNRIVTEFKNARALCLK